MNIDLCRMMELPKIQDARSNLIFARTAAKFILAFNELFSVRSSGLLCAVQKM